MKAIVISALALLLAGCSATAPSAAVPSPTALATVLPAITPLPPTTAAPPPAPTAAPTSIPQPPTLQGADASPPEEIMEPDTLTLTIVYDNNAYDPCPVLSPALSRSHERSEGSVEGLKTAWGFSCLIEYRGQVILFDTGGDSPTLLANMAVLGIDPGQIEAVVLSHNHGDHTGGLSGLLPMAGDDLTVFVPQSFPKRFKDAVQTRARPFDKLKTSLVEVHEPREIGEKVYTTGELGTGIIEQSLAVRTDEGLVVVTGCAHPGIVEVVRKAKALTGDEVYLVVGGFHLGGKSRKEIEGILSEFRRLGVRKVAPCHCTGEQAIRMFRQEYGEDFIQAGAGRVIRVPSPG